MTATSQACFSARYHEADLCSFRSNMYRVSSSGCVSVENTRRKHLKCAERYRGTVGATQVPFIVREDTLLVCQAYEKIKRSSHCWPFKQKG